MVFKSHLLTPALVRRQIIEQTVFRFFYSASSEVGAFFHFFQKVGAHFHWRLHEDTEIIPEFFTFNRKL